jgi:hypothetical protein
MMRLKFEWEVKARSNFKDHGVSIELAKTVFDDAFAIEVLTTGKTTGRSGSSLSVWLKSKPYCLSLTPNAANGYESFQRAG